MTERKRMLPETADGGERLPETSDGGGKWSLPETSDGGEAGLPETSDGGEARLPETADGGERRPEMSGSEQGAALRKKAEGAKAGGGKEAGTGNGKYYRKALGELMPYLAAALILLAVTQGIAGTLRMGQEKRLADLRRTYGVQYEQE